MQTTCSNCAAPLRCGAQEKSCWCQALPVLPAAAYQPAAGCLCAACLQAQLDAGTVLYGIANCDTVKKARAFLTDNGVAYAFWDFKKHGMPATKLRHWLDELGWEALVNKRGTTWRSLTDTHRHTITCNDSAHAALLTYPALMKRPLVGWGNPYAPRLTLGFDAAQWAVLTKI
jgi:arsenate reductase (glutaredoxin)